MTAEQKMIDAISDRMSYVSKTDWVWDMSNALVTLAIYHQYAASNIAEETNK